MSTPTRITSTDVQLAFRQFIKVAREAGLHEAGQEGHRRIELKLVHDSAGWTIIRTDALGHRHSVDGVTDANLGKTAREAWNALGHMTRAYQMLNWSIGHHKLQREHRAATDQVYASHMSAYNAGTLKPGSLSGDDKREIVRLVRSTKMTYREIADRFGCSVPRISQLVRDNN